MLAELNVIADAISAWNEPNQNMYLWCFNESIARYKNATKHLTRRGLYANATENVAHNYASGDEWKKWWRIESVTYFK